MDPDSTLVALARSGNANAFEQLVRRHQVRVFRIALGMLGDPRDAEDAVQETFLQAWRGLPRFRSQSTFSTWIYRIVTNRCLNLRRSRKPSQTVLWDQESGAPGPGELNEARDRLRVLRRAILGLTPEQRATFVLRHLEGRGYEEIVEILGISLPAVKSRLHRARLELAIALSEWK
ncbi:MAG: RNA polymerase sigma factor [Candidatus Dormibacteraeota bacterium]|uniref:RNA polymerase sigma factor n=1 Tax=Candidatus Dormiibacter inghamiae TaxID=3127013 RepID=A0A934KC32_9BACT|nr:RNA polymerase sigma factor [Candidatus Dormibacteraeota bacterium]MBJ7606888.1 RNA polymerase sigma factor [Candidatus Dormibacteraeota bacterium]